MSTTVELPAGVATHGLREARDVLRRSDARISVNRTLPAVMSGTTTRTTLLMLGDGGARMRTRAGIIGLVLSSGCGSGSTELSDAPTPVDLDASFDASIPPGPPPGLLRWQVGNPADAVVQARSGLILMGGGTDVDAAFVWQRDRIGGGDVVVLRTSGTDGYNDYLFSDIGGVDSVETLRVDSRTLANDPYVRWSLEHAEAIFMAGGDQATYVAAWRGTGLTEAIDAAWNRGAVIGGTSAGCAILGGTVYTASQGTVLSSEALAAPYNIRVTLADSMLALPLLDRVVTDTHFGARDRMGRLLAFTARMITDDLHTAPLGIGVDEQTALVVDANGSGTVVGAGAVYVLAPDHPPTTCATGQKLVWSNVNLFELRAGESLSLPAGSTAVPARSISTTGGTLVPADPY